jgi:hypothetical protein
MRPAAGSGTGPVGTAAPGTRGGPRPPSGVSAGISRRKRHGTPGGNARYLPGGNARASRGGNARHPGRKCAASRRETRRMAGEMRQIIARQMVTPQVSGPLDGKRRWLAEPAAERTPGGGRGCVSGLPLLSRGRDRRGRGRTSRTAAHLAGLAGPAGQPISKSQILRSQIPARSIGNDDYPFTYGPVTRTRSAVAAEWPAYSFSASAMAAAPGWGHSSTQQQPIVVHLRRSEDWRHECPRSGSNRHWGPF